MNLDVWNGSCILSPSLISVCDLCNLERSVNELEEAGAQMLHVDILDGHFSPSMPLGLDTIRQLRTRTDIPFDVHLMASSNDFFIDELLNIGVQQIVFHCETEHHIDRQLNRIHAAGVRAGVALKPATPLSHLDYVLEKCDAVLLMLINPGFAQFNSEGQVPYAERKVHLLRKMISDFGLDTKIILDGRVSRENILMFGPDSLADIFVVGSTCIDKMNLKRSASALFAYRDSLLSQEG